MGSTELILNVTLHWSSGQQRPLKLIQDFGVLTLPFIVWEVTTLPAVNHTPNSEVHMVPTIQHIMSEEVPSKLKYRLLRLLFGEELQTCLDEILLVAEEAILGEDLTRLGEAVHSYRLLEVLYKRLGPLNRGPGEADSLLTQIRIR